MVTGLCCFLHLWPSGHSRSPPPPPSFTFPRALEGMCVFGHQSQVSTVRAETGRAGLRGGGLEVGK